MPTHCCVPECTKKGYREEDGTKVSFFKFPIENPMKKKWLHAIRREEGKYFKVTESTRVYSRHFRKGDIKKIPFWEKWTKTRSCSLCFSVDSNIATPKKGVYGKILWRDRFEKCIKCVFFSQGHPPTVSSYIHWKQFLAFQNTFRSLEMHSKRPYKICIC